MGPLGVETVDSKRAYQVLGEKKRQYEEGGSQRENRMTEMINSGMLTARETRPSIRTLRESVSLV